ncbi:hypothetical protein GCM10027277_57060 [Pseudoduganella ginsengisoli]|uniref:Uncharacterized protein n=1 Tax=Pseudoduganella ginsengisoli TaxID=1462440 RepID=A0A6L6Q2I3_9BURK|nr:hypothetical protein [Pseudoduganella ginsengisoli]MTW03624.1 hypothetical protein [Pseudoduganella ginsengisoli]
MNILWAWNWLGAAVLLAGFGSAALYGRKRRWADAGLVLAGAAALAALLSEPARPMRDADELAIASDVPGDALARSLLAVPEAGSLALTGHGLTDAQWQDVPARPLRWTAPNGGVLLLDFARTVPLGRAFTLTVRRSQPVAAWRLQLLAENGQVLADAAAPVAASAQAQASAPAMAQLSVSWLPPLAEKLVLRARLLDGNGKALAEGPVPLLVTEPVPLQVIGRFGAPSFDTRVLNDWLTASGAIVDWQTTLGKGLSRTESARAALDKPNAQFIDAAWFESAPQPARAALLGQVAQGLPLVVLGGNASQPAVWQRELALPLAPQSATTEREDTRVFGAAAQQIALAPASFNPVPQAAAWRVLATDSRGKPWLWQRSWKQGGIVWVGVADWHRHAIASPVALGAWWQTLIDAAVNGGAQGVVWEQPDAMPVAGMRTQVCAQGVAQAKPLSIQGMPDIAWQARSGRAEGLCAAFIPQRAGWHMLSSGGAQHAIYVYGERDWPQWRHGLRQQATRAYAARTLSDASVRSQSAPLPAWPFALAVAAAMLALWYRERRLTS